MLSNARQCTCSLNNDLDTDIITYDPRKLKSSPYTLHVTSIPPIFPKQVCGLVQAPWMTSAPCFAGKARSHAEDCSPSV